MGCDRPTARALLNSSLKIFSDHRIAETIGTRHLLAKRRNPA
jgi:hypothetical protein